MTQPLTIDFVSDVACPWCAIGLSSLQLALSRLGDTVDARIVVHPFELNPQMGPGGEDIVEYLGRKYGRTPAQIAETQAMIRERGESGPGPVHLLNGTAVTDRYALAILENFQGVVPDALKAYGAPERISR